ncbi:hypothetical protein DICVIV_06692 [Dictyocaulus viviparus]|uniref:G-protein coupled receptors family 1 profile domain-containing protein n=1 Tax=Dictyocaulus viviparus TaxID=29172 RepID=A0A0D8XRE5_DICVI|nr:hypothetical protein DICVIV_06692 [Dictyocaulus viviparus]
MMFPGAELGSTLMLNVDQKSSIIGFVDIVVIINYFLFTTARYQFIFGDFYYTLNASYFPTWCFIQPYISVTLRCFGVLMITFHRYVSICRHHTKIEKFINVSHRWTLPIIQWIVPLLYSIPLFIMDGVVFESIESLELIAKREQIMLATSMTASSVYVTFVLCSFCYGALLKFFIKNRYNKNEQRYKTRIKTLHSNAWLTNRIRSTVCLLYHTDDFLTEKQCELHDGPVFTMRIIFPLISSIMSYINIWLMFILNSDIRKKILSLIFLQKEKNSSTKIIAIKSTLSTPDLRKS